MSDLLTLETLNIHPKMAQLARLPDELISNIAYHAALNDRQDGRAAPSLLRLALVARRFNETLSSDNAAQLHARLFQDRFDRAAVKRRFGAAATLPSSLADEYRRRLLLLGRIKTQDETDLDATLWLAYLMLLEDDGKNLDLLTQAKIATFVKTLYDREFRSAVAQPGLPAPTITRALLLHIAALLLRSQVPLELAVARRVIQPWVFGAHRYAIAFAAWTLRGLPRNGTIEARDVPADATDWMLQAFSTRQKRSAHVRILGRDHELAIPPPGLAAIVVFGRVNRPDVIVGGRPEGGLASEEDSLGTRVEGSNSQLYDLDFWRLASCANVFDPRSGLQFSAPQRMPYRGMFSGTWFGRFSFCEFVAYREMIIGRVASAYEGSVADQLQVWRLHEKVVRLGPDDVEGGSHHIFNAGFPENCPPINDADVVKEGEELDPNGRYEIQIEGRGHSAWGQFGLKGRLRAWDGLLLLRKLYDGVHAGERGAWLYRGYISNGEFIGRWRDAFTPSEHIGYEGAL